MNDQNTEGHAVPWAAHQRLVLSLAGERDSAEAKRRARALALYDVAAWVRDLAPSYKSGSGARIVAERIYGYIHWLAGQAEFGDLWDPAIQADGSTLRAAETPTPIEEADHG